MKPYNALVKKNDEGKISDLILIKEGFSFFAFLFGPLWFLYHKMWKEFLVLIIVDIIFGFYADIFSEFDKTLLQIGFFYIVALNANFWLCLNLKNKNYQFAGLFLASDVKAATLKFTENFTSNSFDNLILCPQLHENCRY